MTKTTCGPRAGDDGAGGGAWAARHTPAKTKQQGDETHHGWEIWRVAAGRTSTMPFIVRQWAGNVQMKG